MALNPANLTWNGVSDAGGGYSSLDGAYQWEYVDMGQTLAALDGQSGNGLGFFSQVREGDFVQVTGSDGDCLSVAHVQSPNSAGGRTVQFFMIAIGPAASTGWWK